MLQGLLNLKQAIRVATQEAVGRVVRPYPRPVIVAELRYIGA